MASTVTARPPAWADGIAVSGAEIRSAIGGTIWANAGLVNGLRPVQIPTPAMQIRLPAGRSVVSDGAGGYIPIELLTQTDLDVSASSPTQPRIDSLIAEFVDNGGSSIYRFRVVAGTAAASPVQPTLPFADQPTGKTLRIANIAVAANATTITNANITLQASVAALASYGRMLEVSSDGGRPTNPAETEQIWRLDKNCGEINFLGTWYEFYVAGGGNSWTTYTPALTASTSNPTLGTGSLRDGAWTRYGKMIEIRGAIKFGSSGAAAGSGTYRVSLPFTAKTLSVGRHVGSAYAFDASGNNAIDGVCYSEIGNWGVINLVLGGNLTTNTVPWTWAALDEIGFHIAIELP